jgi:hypothetical protein
MIEQDIEIVERYKSNYQWTSTFEINKSEWKKSDGSVYINKYGQYISRTKLLNKVGLILNILTIKKKIIEVDIN